MKGQKGMRLRLTDEQIQSASVSDEAFVSWFCDEILRHVRPDLWAELGPDICSNFTKTGLSYAKHFGFFRAEFQAQYVFLMWQLAPNLFEIPEISSILRSDVPEQQKIDALWNIDESVAEKALANADMLHWTPEEVPGNILGVEVDDLSDLYDEFPFLKP